MFAYLMRVSNTDALVQIEHIAQVVFRSDTGVVGAEALRDVLDDLERIPGVTGVRRERTTRLEKALRAKGWYDTPPEEWAHQCEDFIRAFRGQAQGDKRAGLIALQQLRGTYEGEAAAQGETAKEDPDAQN